MEILRHTLTALTALRLPLLLLTLTVSLTEAAEPHASLSPKPPVFAHPDTEEAPSWSCSLISDEKSVHSNQWTAFRRTFTLRKVPQKAITRIAADTKYWLWVNGKLAVREGGLKRGPTPKDSYFDEVDLRPWLKQGRNTIAVLVWHFGKEGFSHKDSGMNGLIFQLQDENGVVLLASDTQWKARSHPAFQDTGEPVPNFRLPESNIRFDATHELLNWTSETFDDRRWPNAIDHGRAPCAPWGQLVRRGIPFWRESPIRDYPALTDEKGSIVRLPFASHGETISARLPYNAQVTPFLEVDAPAGRLIKVQTDNYSGGGANNVRAEYVTRGGRQEFECYGWMNGHHVLYSIPDGVRVLRLGYQESGYDTDFAGAFRCDDIFLNRLREKALRTLYLTMRDNYMDCPDRERAQWWGDVVNELGEVPYAFDARADALTRKAILELIGWQKPDGALFSPIPAGNWNKDLPLQMLAAIGRQGFWTYAFYSGDFETLRVTYPYTKHYLEMWEPLPNGLVKPMPGAWPWGDWGENVDMTLLATIWYHLALQGQLNAAETLGKTEDISWLKKRLAEIAEAFPRTFWTGKEYRSPDYSGATDDRANALAVVADLVPRENFPAVLSVLSREEHASPYMEKYVLEALCLMDAPERAQERITRRYAKMVNHPDYTTLWEGWGIGDEGYGGGTINHAWSGGPLTIMSRYFAGIAPTSPAFATYRVRPQLGHLKEVECRLATRLGAIQTTMRRTEQEFQLTLDSPRGTVATIELPADQRQKITSVELNGSSVWPWENAPASAKGTRFLGTSPDGRLCFEVPSGRWTFEMKTTKAPKTDKEISK